MEVKVIHTPKLFINLINKKLNRLLLLVLTAGLLLPITAKAESDFAELNPVNPYSYKKSSVLSWWKNGKRYISFKGTTQLPDCFERDGHTFCASMIWWKKIIRENKVEITKNDQLAWDYEVDCIDRMFNREGDWQGWITVRVDPTAELVANKFCPLNNWNKLPIDPTK